MRDQALWTWHIIAGGVIAVLLGLHMTIMHLDVLVGVFNAHGGHPIDWANVLERTKSAGFMVGYVLLLAAALYHGFYGLRNILFELNPGSTTKRVISAVLVVAGLSLFAFGTWSAVAGFQLKAS